MRLSHMDASFLYAESVSGPMHISSIYVLEGELETARVHEHFAERIHLVPSYRRKVAHVPLNLGHPKWWTIPTSIWTTTFGITSCRRARPCRMASTPRRS